MGKINWDVVKNIAIAVPTGLAVITTLLTAIGLSPVEAGQITAIVLAAAAVLVWIIDTVKRALAQTDAGKANALQRLDPTGQRAVLQKLPPETVVQAAKERPEVAAVVVNPAATGPVAWMATDPTESKVRVGA